MRNAHRPWDLKQMQSLPLEAKIRMTKERIEAWYNAWWRYEIEDTATGKTRFVTFDTRDQLAEPPMKESEWVKSAYPGAVYVSFSGGKDSTVLKHIVDSMYDDVPAIFVNTGLEFPEIQKFAMTQKNVVTVRPEMRFDEVLKTYGYPVISKDVALRLSYAQKGAPWALNAVQGLNKDGTYSEFKQRYKRYADLVDSGIPVSSYCCDVMKKKPAKAYEKLTGRKPILGTLACESKQREQAWMRTGCNGFDSTRPKSQPLAFWTEQDILHYIKKYDVPYCSIYGDIEPEESQMCFADDEEKLKTTGRDRTGCIFCMFGCKQDRQPTRFQQLKETHPRQYEYCINGGEMVDGRWQPNKEGLGLGFVLDYIGVKYD